MPRTFCFFYEVEMIDRSLDLIDRKRAIEALEKIKQKKQACNCSSQAIRQADALGYAIAVLKKLPKATEEK